MPLGVGGVQGDQMRQIVGQGPLVNDPVSISTKSPFSHSSSQIIRTAMYGSGINFYPMTYNFSNAVPIGPAFAPRRWGALACAYLGTPMPVS